LNIEAQVKRTCRSVRIAALPGQFFPGADDNGRKEVGVLVMVDITEPKAGGASAGNIGGEKTASC